MAPRDLLVITFTLYLSAVSVGWKKDSGGHALFLFARAEGRPV
jgi:hypothetical protein